MRNWFAEHRIAWIVESIQIFESINRIHVERKFGISAIQASHDFQEVIKRYPDLMTYDKSVRAYRLNK